MDCEQCRGGRRSILTPHPHTTHLSIHMCMYLLCGCPAAFRVLGPPLRRVADPLPEAVLLIDRFV